MADEPPVWAHERAEVRPHDPQWTIRAASERERLSELLGPWLTADLEHVGSTAIPGLAAKPIIDLAASVTGLDAVTAAAMEGLAAEGWCHVPPSLDGRPWRRFFVKPDASGRHRAAHLHLIEAGHPRWSEQIAFRDALRADPALARDYEHLKRRLSARHGDDRETYTEGKAAFIAAALRPQPWVRGDGGQRRSIRPAS
ncbi:GrpB family protein [Glycomyces sp. NPDC046736]|uniref:GrpB family protein n=1 Tax=Glycomyces sp. NPDC046736 TaxID=3155615 RepID=UPI0033E8052A